MGVRNRGIPAEIGGCRYLTFRGDPFCFRGARACGSPVVSPYGSQAGEWSASLALARELTAMGYAAMAESLDVSIREVARARNSGRECRGKRDANRHWSRLEE